MAFDIEAFKAQGIRIRAEQNAYRVSSELWKLRERARSLKTPKAREKAWTKFTEAFKARFPEGSTVWIDDGINFDTFEAGGFATYSPMQVKVSWNSGHSIAFEGLTYDRVEIYYDPCGHDNLMWLERAQLTNASKQRVRRSECNCDNGKHWNNGDDTSGQSVDCRECA